VAALCAHSAELEPQAQSLANLKERLAVLTEPFTTMVMDVAAKPRDTFILNRGDYAQPTVKGNRGHAGLRCPRCRRARRRTGSVSREWMTMKDIRSRRAWW
jgi:hypothetical protein